MVIIPFVESGSYPVRSGNTVRPLIDGIPAFRRICEAIEAATSYVWVTVTFMWPTFEMPDGLGTALDVLDRAAAHGVDVRIIFWRPDPENDEKWKNAFRGSEDHIRQLEARESGVSIRWDRNAPGFCQHQKSWLMDDSEQGEIAFVGGINLNPNSVVAPGHYAHAQGEAQNHDIYVEIAGPSTVDVRHNFVQRWNEASDHLIPGGRWGRASEADLPFTTHISGTQGDALVQIQRTVHSAEQTIFEQYCAAIDSARCSIYIENQYVTVLEILACLHRALERGIEVVLLLPAEPDVYFRSVIEDQPDFKEAWVGLGAYENFTLAGIAGLSAIGERKPVYIHSKVMLIDDVWATVGSCNLHRFSLFGNAEMNASFSSAETVHAFRSELLREHLGKDTSNLDDRSALREFRSVALQNRERGNTDWQGLAFAIDPVTYGR